MFKILEKERKNNVALGLNNFFIIKGNSLL